jgi:uncharacterized protein (PEP-CTERM system associated)
MRLIPLLCRTAGSPGGATCDGSTRRALQFALLAVATASSLSLRAQTAPVKPPALHIGVDGGFVVTDNSGLSPSGQERADLITTVRPTVAYSRQTSRLEFDLAGAVGLFAYAKGTQKSEVLPELRAFARSELIERWLYFDAAAEVGQTESNSFGARVNEFSTVNRRTETSFRASPYMVRDLSSNSFVLALYDVATENNGADTGARRVSQRAVARYEIKPVPVGAAFEIARLDNETQGVDESRLTVDTARAVASLAVQNQMILSAIAGTDHSDTTGPSHTDPLYGASVLWNPGPRTLLDATLEHRFFGLGGSLALRHRTPLMSFAVAIRRAPATVTSTLGQVDTRSGLRPLLDAILTSRYPDPAARRALVQSVAVARAQDVRLPNSASTVDQQLLADVNATWLSLGTLNPSSIVADYPQLQTDANATWLYLGTRNSAALTLYMQELQQLRHEGDPPPAGGVQNDRREAGALFQVARRLEPNLSAGVALRWSRITGLAARAGETSEEWVERLVFNRAISSRTSISAGLQHNRFSSTAAGQHDYKATLAFVGMRHSF